MKFPSAWSTTPFAVTAKAEPKKVESKINMSDEVAGQGKCPECKRPMEVVYAGGTPMWACAADRITIPLPNGHENQS